MPEVITLPARMPCSRVHDPMNSNYYPPLYPVDSSKTTSGTTFHFSHSIILQIFYGRSKNKCRITVTTNRIFQGAGAAGSNRLSLQKPHTLSAVTPDPPVMNSIICPLPWHTFRGRNGEIFMKQKRGSTAAQSSKSLTNHSVG